LIGSLAAPSQAWAEGEPQVQPVPALGADLSSLTVSGLSSGGYMAVQMQTAFSSTVKGAAIFAGGPFGCARGETTSATLGEAMMHCVNVQGALWNPMKSYLGPPLLQARVEDAQALAVDRHIDPVAGLADDHIYLFSGNQDKTVPQGVMEVLRDWYLAFVPAENIHQDFGRAAGHAMITDDWGSACPETQSPYINDCDLDGAGEALKVLYGPLNPAAAGDGTQDGALYAVDQGAFVPQDAPSYSGLDRKAYVFVPDQCKDGAEGPPCRLHVAFHGCQQGEAMVGDVFIRHAGYNRWAASNRIIVLYPQAAASTFSLTNPRGCWDWWGYSGQNYLSKQGVQMQTVWSMIERLSQKP
jgi:hypothetical protein